MHLVKTWTTAEADRAIQDLPQSDLKPNAVTSGFFPSQHHVEPCHKSAGREVCSVRQQQKANNSESPLQNTYFIKIWFLPPNKYYFLFTHEHIQVFAISETRVDKS